MARIEGRYILLWTADTKVVKQKSDVGSATVYWDDAYYIGTSMDDLDDKIAELGLTEASDEAEG